MRKLRRETRWDRDVREAMKGRERFSVTVPVELIATSLWECGEDALADRALTMSSDDHAAVQRICAVYEDPTYPLPVEGQRINHRHVSALAAIAYLEGRLRPLAQNRSRPRKHLPARFRPDPADDHATSGA